MSVIGIPSEGQRAHDQATSRLPNRALVPELILLVLLPLRDALNLRLMQTVHLVLVAALLIDYAQVQFKVLPVLLLLERIHLPGNIVHHGAGYRAHPFHRFLTLLLPRRMVHEPYLQFQGLHLTGIRPAEFNALTL